MIGEGEPLKTTEDPTKFAKAQDAVRAAAETVQETTRHVADAIEAGRRPGAPLDRLSDWAREAPLQALAVAFIAGALIARRRR